MEFAAGGLSVAPDYESRRAGWWDGVQRAYRGYFVVTWYLTSVWLAALAAAHVWRPAWVVGLSMVGGVLVVGFLYVGFMLWQL